MLVLTHDKKQKASRLKAKNERKSSLKQSTKSPKDIDQALYTLDSVKTLRKRNYDASLDKSPNVGETDVTVGLEPRKRKKRDGNYLHPPPYPDPTIDESLSQQSRKALLYAYERSRGLEHWKFNKARQNWLLRNVWSEQAVPWSYVPLVIEYLIGVKGGAREKLIAVCTSKLSTLESRPTQQGAHPSDSNDGSGIADQQPSTSRALSVLHALKND